MNEEQHKKLEAAIAHHKSHGANADEQTRKRLAELEEQRQRNLRRITLVEEQAKQRAIDDWNASYERDINVPTSVEALSWLQNAGNGVRSISGEDEKDRIAGEDAIRLVQSLYENGAIKVTAIKAEGLLENEEHQYTSTLVIELPGNAHVQAKLCHYVKTQEREKEDSLEDSLNANTATYPAWVYLHQYHGIFICDLPEKGEKYLILGWF